MADASVTLDLDAREFDSRLAAVEQRVSSSSRTMSSGFDAAAEGGGRLFTSSHRVARQVGMLATQFSSGADASQLFGAGLMGLERAMRLPLGALAGLAVGAVFFEQLAKAHAESTKLHNELNALIATASTGASFKTFDQMQSQIEKIRAKLAEVKKFEGSVMGGVLNFVTLHDPLGKGHAAEREAEPAHRAIRRSMAEEARARAFENLQEEKKLRDIPGSGMTPGAFSAERSEAQHKMLGSVHAAMQAKNMALVAEEFRKYKDQLTAINQKEAEQKDKYAEAVEAAKEKTALQALEMSGETKLAEVLKEQLDYQRQINDEKRKGHPELAAELQKQKDAAANKGALGLFPEGSGFGSIADRWKPGGFGSIEDRFQPSSGMNSMQPSAQGQQFRAALQTTEGILREIGQNTKAQFLNK
jgi:hypothetical protein